MSIHTLNASIDNEFAIARDRATRTVKAADPLSMISDGSSFGGQEYGGEFEQDQYEHYRGRMYSAGRVIVQRFSMLPWRAARVSRGNRRRSLGRAIRKGEFPEGVPEWIGDPDALETVPVHPVLEVLEDPNPKMTAFNMWEMVGGSMVATGRGFVVAVAGEGRPLDLWPVPSTWMRPSKDRSKWIMKPPSAIGSGITVDDAQVAYCYFADPSNIAGAISPLAMMAREVLVDESILGAQHAEFKNGPVPKVALIAGDVMGETGFMEDGGASTPISLEPYQRRQIQTWFKQQYASAMKYGLPIVLDAIIRDVKVLSRKPAEMAFRESAGLTEDHINKALGVSKVLMGEFENVNRASATVVNEYFVENVLGPLAALISQALTKKFGPLFSVGGEKLKLWAGPPVIRDPVLELEWWKFAGRTYSVQRNDVRRKIGLPPLAGMDDVVIPDRLEEREPDEDFLSPNRLNLEPVENGNGRA
jgi:hypothetical protein